MTRSHTFSSLCAGFLERLSANIPGEEALDEGFEFETEGLGARVEPGLPPSEDGGEGDFLITISVIQLDLEDPTELAEPLAMLARLNHHSRRQHPWVAVIDAAQQLSLCRRMPLPSPGVDDLERAISQGLELGQSLRELWNAVRDSGGGQGAARSSEPPFFGLQPGLKA